MSLQLIGLTKRFGDVTAVDGVHLAVDQGELLAVVGPSGCGKTTLIRMIAGLETPDEGRVLIRGRDATHLPPERRNVSIVFQNFALFPQMTVAENVAYGLRWRRLDRAERQRRVTEMLEMVGLSSLRHRRPHQLSAGQQQRAALARALAPQPETLLLDEPLSALDADLRERLRLEIRRIQKELGITTILVTHDQEEALGIADRVAVMNQGRLVQVGRPWEVYDAPATPFVARFIGKGTLVEAKAGPAGAELKGLGPVPAGHVPPRFRSAGRALVLIRPEAVRLLEDGGPPRSFSNPSEAPETPERPASPAPGLHFTAELEDVTFAGQAGMVHLRAGELRLIAFCPGHLTARLKPRAGSRLACFVPYDALRWVDPGADRPAAGDSQQG
ncbi:MAG: ABC transporter ATP-binding protein [Clostridia bacterium]